MTTPLIDFSGLARLPETYDRAFLASTRRGLGDLLAGDRPNYGEAAGRLLAAGDLETGMSLARLGQQMRGAERANQMLAPFFGGGGQPPQSQMGAPPPAASGPPADMSVPRGVRNNNPANLEASPFTQRQAGFQGSDGRFGRFETMDQGILAADNLLRSYGQRGINTVAGVVGRWAPPNENNTGAYMATVARALGVDPNAPIDLSDPQVRAAILSAKFRVENGREVAPAASIFQAITNGGASPRNQPPAPVQVASLSGGVPAAPAGARPMQSPPMPPTNAGGAPINLPPPHVLLQIINDPFAPPESKQIAASMLQQHTQPTQYGFQAVQGLGVVRTNPRTGRAEVVAAVPDQPTVLPPGASAINRQGQVLAGGQQEGRLITAQERQRLVAEGRLEANDRRPIQVMPNGEYKFADEASDTFRRENEQALAKAFSEEAGRLGTSQQNLAVIGEMRRLLSQTGSGAWQQLKALAGNYGIDLGNVSDIQAVQSLLDRLTPQMRVPGSGSTSDMEMRTFRNSLPRLINQPGGNQIILDTMEALTRHDLERSRIAQSVQLGEITRQEGLRQMRALDDPLKTFRGWQTGQSGRGERQGPPAAPAAGTVEDGWRFRGGDPSLRENWERVAQ